MRSCVMVMMLVGCGRLGFDRLSGDDTLYDGGAGGGGVIIGGPAMSLELLAGDIGGPGNVDGIGSVARFFCPDDVAVDDAGNVYVADASNYIVRKISTGGEVTTLVGAVGVP